MDALDLPQEADQEVNRILRDHFGFEKDGDIKELKLKSEVFWQEFLLDRVTQIHARGGARYSAEKFIEKKNGVCGQRRFTQHEVDALIDSVGTWKR